MKLTKAIRQRSLFPAATKRARMRRNASVNTQPAMETLEARRLLTATLVDDFNDGVFPDQWTGETAGWSESGGVLHNSAPSNFNVPVRIYNTDAVLPADFTPFEASIDFRRTHEAGRNESLWLISGDPDAPAPTNIVDGMLAAYWDGYGVGTGLWGWNESGFYTRNNSSPIDNTGSVDYRVSVNVVESASPGIYTWTATLTDLTASSTVLTVSQNSSHYPAGETLGIATRRANADNFHIDNFTVTGLGSANLPPEVTATLATVTVNEGDLATNSGTVSDPDGDAVVLSATGGSVTNNGDGTWSWELATDDGPVDGTGVTISGDDGNGGTADAAFTVIVNNVAPDASISGPASGLIGDAINFTLGADDVSSADQAAGFDYAIDWDGDGTVDQTISGADGLGVSHTFATGGSTTVIVTATDKDGGTSSQVSHTIEVIQPVDVDVKPGNAKNKVNAKSQGRIAVAIYTTADFDAATVVGSSVQLAGINADHFALEDVDGDGDLDLILHFSTQAVIDAVGVDLNSGESASVEAELTGETIDEVMIQGFDTIEFFQPGKGKGRK